MKPAKTFALHWGSGVIAEEAQSAGPYHRPTIQLLKFVDGDAAGSWQIRFCYYDHAGRFQRSPLIIGERDIRELRGVLRRTPRLRALLKRLTA